MGAKIPGIREKQADRGVGRGGHEAIFDGSGGAAGSGGLDAKSGVQRAPVLCEDDDDLFADGAGRDAETSPEPAGSALISCGGEVSHGKGRRSIKFLASVRAMGTGSR